MDIVFATLAALLPIINPFTAAPLFIGMTEGDTEAERAQQGRRGVIYMVCILTAILVGGSFIMNFFGLSLLGIRIAGGVSHPLRGHPVYLKRASWGGKRPRVAACDSPRAVHPRCGR